MINICVVRHKGYIKANMNVPCKCQYKSVQKVEYKNVQFLA